MIKPDCVQRGYVRSHAPLLRDRYGYLLPRRLLRERLATERSERDGAKTHARFSQTLLCVPASL